MNKILRNILAVIAGLVVGSFVNGGLVQIGHSVFPLEGFDTNDMDALAEAMPHMEVEHFIFPFLAHALGTLVGAAIAAAISSNRKMRVALIVGGIYLIAGIWVNIALPGPLWFAILDILVAYLPMAWLGAKIALLSKKS